MRYVRILCYRRNFGCNEHVDPSAKQTSSSNESSSIPNTVFSMPLLPQKSDTSSTSTSVPTDENDDNDRAKLGYKGLEDDEDDDDKVWNNFNSTLEAVRVM